MEKTFLPLEKVKLAPSKRVIIIILYFYFDGFPKDNFSQNFKKFLFFKKRENLTLPRNEEDR